jgi:hypothetical protein
MRYLFILFLAGCSIKAQDNQQLRDDIEFNNLISKIEENNVKSIKIQKKAAKKEKQLVSKAVSTIVAMKGEISELKSEISEMKVKVDTIYIHDTVLIKEKKNFWGKVKKDTIN